MSDFGADYWWMSRDGLKLYARVYGAEGSGKLPVVCIPGLTRNSRDFSDLAPWIAARGRRVYAVDLRGRGQSERGPDPRRYNPRVYADDMAMLLKSVGANKALFVGTSLGGLVTMSIAASNNGIIGGAVLNDIGPQVARAGLARIRSYAGKKPEIKNWDDAAAYAQRINGVAFPDADHAFWVDSARRLFRDDGVGPVLDYDPLIFRPPNPMLAFIAQPLLWAAFNRLARTDQLSLIYGGITDVLDTKTIARMQRRAPRMEVAAVPRVGHAPTLAEPEALRAIGRFLANAA